ncbi:MAG: class I poly(R)-hydroxyalkanoic acid synthase [Pseudomonadota bacterium]|nr:class I poly(R)-hydroxyalkanoic acid synthase [Pseudomonadota bacterium]
MKARSRSTRSAPTARTTATPAAPHVLPDSPADFNKRFGGLLKSFEDAGGKAPAMLQMQADYVRGATELWNQSLTQGFGEGGNPLGKTPRHTPTPLPDRRFGAAEWVGNPATAYIAQMYLLNARTLMQMADAVETDDKTRARIKFAMQQWIDATSPSNSLALNPEALKKAVDTQGQSLSDGLKLLMEDLQKGHVSQTDERGFEVGRNVATTPGSVVYENEFMQLIEYAPIAADGKAAKVHARPMLFVPPCINKYYILDLQPANSVIRHTVEQGHRTFVVSWRNPDASMVEKTWDDYIEHGPIAAIRAVQAISGEKTINTLGFCVGGTILSTALAVLAARGEQPAESVTLLTTLLDFSSTGILDIFIDENMVKLREMTIGAQAPSGPGLLKGSELATTFSFLRPNDLVWNYVVSNYLKGETPPPFDLLYWNGDSTNLPGPMYCWYLRHTYLQNELMKPGALTVCGEKVDLGSIESPFFIYGSRDDHIVPWMAAYASVPLLRGKRRFVLGASGHIAGVINPPAKGKRSHWTNNDLPESAEAWFDGATEHPGSWWPAWMAWLKPHGGKQIAAPKHPGSAKFKPIEPAPGRYVKEKASA